MSTVVPSIRIYWGRSRVPRDGDRSATNYGTGMQGMLDRLEALGGGMEVDTAPNRGTIVRGRIRVA
jgi:signal transduction histidine kinase